MRTESHDLRRILLCPQYEVKAPMPSACFRNICKQMAKMHEAIYELLPEEQTQVRSFCFLYSFCVCDSLLITDLSCISIYRCCFWGSMPVSKCIWRGSWLGLELLMMEDRSMGKCPENQLMIGVCWYDRAALPASLWREVAPLFLLVFPVVSHFIEREFWTLHEYLTCLYICYIKVLELYLTNLTQI